MGSHARLYLSGAPSELEPTLRARLGELEARWSRFVPTSEISRINAAAGAPVEVSGDTMLLAAQALAASRRTQGWFDPTLLDPLEAAGYDRDFDAVVASRPARFGVVALIDRCDPARSVRVRDWTPPQCAIAVDERARTVSVASGAGFDPGGIGKGLAADLVVADAVAGGAAAVLVDLGGDIACAGRAPEGGWAVAIDDPFAPGMPSTEVRIPWGAVATSSITRRRWHHDGEDRHHLIDPSTGRPSDSDLLSVSVIAGACWLAETLAKAALVAGSEVGAEILADNGVEAQMVRRSGEVIATPGWSAFAAVLSGAS